MTSSLDVGRDAFERGAWREAYTELTSADRAAPIALEDLERLATAAMLIGSDDTSEVWERVYRECLRVEDHPRALHGAFWLAFGLLSKGEAARAGGWLTRAQKLLDEHDVDCAERGYLLVPQAIGCLDDGDAAAALALYTNVRELASRFGDPDVATLGCLGCGQALIELGERVDGIALVDEALVAVTAGETSPLVSGIVYCAAIEACQRIFDLRRAREWTVALTRWCDAQPDLVPYRGQCLVHRAEILQLHGAWRDAEEEAARACARLEGEPAAGDALYQTAELHRLRGELAQAEDAYRAATRAGRQPQPGLAMLRLAQGQVEAADAAIRRVVDEAKGPVARAQVLGPYVEIVLAAGDVAAARAGADELETIAAEFDARLLTATAAQATGAVLLAEGEARGALATLRRAWRVWQEWEAPYEAARVRVLVGLAYRALGDADTAAMELDAAQWVFQELGAEPELARLAGLALPAAVVAFAPLTAREVEVLTLVARGRTNRAIAGELFISDKTVARHVSNIFTKLGLSSRAAATAWAYEHGLVVPSTSNDPVGDASN